MLLALEVKPDSIVRSVTSDGQLYTQPRDILRITELEMLRFTVQAQRELVCAER
jgi:hypothetical protein